MDLSVLCRQVAEWGSLIPYPVGDGFSGQATGSVDTGKSLSGGPLRDAALDSPILQRKRAFAGGKSLRETTRRAKRAGENCVQPCHEGRIFEVTAGGADFLNSPM